MTNDEITQALQILVPGVSWSLLGDKIEDIKWDSENDKPTEKAILDTIKKLPELAQKTKDEEEKQANSDTIAKQAIFNRLGLTADEAALLFK